MLEADLKHLFAILSLFFFITSSASHLVGGEITYKHIANNTYDVHVTLYRDCQDSKLGGTGGGSSTSNSADLEEVYLRTISSACGNTSIGKITLTKLGYTDITTVCNTASKCQSNSTYGYGIEAHYYKGTVDFDNYSQYDGCTIQIFFDKAERSNSLSTISSEENDLYNFAIINPWKGNYNSPQFLDAPKIIFNLNQPAYSNDRISKNAGDSIAIKWSRPFSNYKTPINYKAGFSKESFITPYCPNGSGCAANPSSSIPEGIYLNPTTGDYIFTPTSSNQKSTRVLEVEQWRNVDGTMTLFGVVRRDVQVIIANQNNNNAPQIQADNVYYACVGQDFSATITATDYPKTVNGSTLANDTVAFQVYHNLANLSSSIKNTSSAPYHNVELSFTPTNADVGTHYIHIKAKDNFCPEYAESNKVITLIVAPTPTIDFNVVDEFCGNNKISLNANREGIFNLTVDDGTTTLFSDEIADGDVFTHYKLATLNYSLAFTDNHGCSATLDKTISNKGNSEIGDALVLGETEYCDNEVTSITLLHSSYLILNTKWASNAVSLGNDDTLKTNPFSGLLEANYTLIRNSMECEMSQSIDLISHKNPTVTVADIPDLCYAASFDLSNIATNPSNGNWTSDITVVNNKLQLNEVENSNQAIGVSYTYTSSETGCATTIYKTLNVLPSPEMKLRDEVICGDNFEYRLTNAISRPFHHAVENISWRILNNPAALKNNPYPVIDVPTYGAGIYTIEAKNSFDNGCETTDTATITVDQGLVLTTNGVSKICQQNNAVELDEYFDLNAKGGGWNSIDAEELLFIQNFTPKRCGTYHFDYTYDKNGCYDQLSVALEVVCKPTFEFDLPDSICANNEPLTLSASSQWSGVGIDNNVFDPSNLSGKINLVQTQLKDGCLFDSSGSIVVLQPLAISLSNIPLSLCEGSELDFTINSQSYCKSELISCKGTTPIVGNTIHYTPTACDLAQNKIALSIRTHSDALCPSLVSNVSVNYFEKPSALIPEIILTCAPYNLGKVLTANKGLNTSISHTLIGENSTFKGNENLDYSLTEAGKYTLHVFTSDDNGCKNQQLVRDYLTIHPKPESSFEISNGNRVTLSEREVYLNNRTYISSGYSNYTWLLDKNNQVNQFSTDPNPIYLLPADTGLFGIHLIAASNNNCKDTSTRHIRVVPDILIFIPNAFTPNNKGPEANDKFTVSSAHAQEYFIEIFNKWGQKVYSSTNIKDSWDGSYLGKLCQDGVYAYSIELINKAGLKYTYHGTVNLIR